MIISMKDMCTSKIRMKMGICIVLMAVMTGCGENAAAPESSGAAEIAWEEGEKGDGMDVGQDGMSATEDGSQMGQDGMSAVEAGSQMGQDGMSVMETGSQAEQKTVSSMGSVPCFKDDAGRNTQTVGGYLYGYWYNRLCRYDPETLEETVLYEAVSPQNGDFCIWGDYVYFMDVPKVNAVEKLYGYLCRVPCDGSGEAVRLASVPMPGQLCGGCYYSNYTLDTYEDILYLICQSNLEENLYFRLDRKGDITRAAESETLYGRLPEGEFDGWRSWDYGYKQMTLPYAMRNYGYVFMRGDNLNLVRIDLESGQVETVGNACAITNDSVIYSMRDNGKDQWYKMSLDDLNNVQKLGDIMGGWSDEDPQLAAWNEEGMYFTTGTEEYDGNLIFVDWEGERTVMGGNYSSDIIMNTDSPIVHFNGQYYYYVADRKGVSLVRRLRLTEEKERTFEEVTVYSREPGCELADRERTDGTWKDIYTKAWVEYRMEKVVFREDTAAFGRINDFLENLYVQDAERLEEYQRFVKESTEEDNSGWIDHVERSDSYSVCYLDEDYVGIVLEWDEFWKGAAHGMYGSVYYMFDRHTGERVGITDVLEQTPEEICEIIAPYVKTAADGGKDREGLETAVLQTGRFYLTEEGVGIHFDVYEISAYANGARDIVVPYEAFE